MYVSCARDGGATSRKKEPIDPIGHPLRDIKFELVSLQRRSDYPFNRCINRSLSKSLTFLSVFIRPMLLSSRSRFFKDTYRYVARRHRVSVYVFLKRPFCNTHGERTIGVTIRRDAPDRRRSRGCVWRTSRLRVTTIGGRCESIVARRKKRARGGSRRVHTTRMCIYTRADMSCARQPPRLKVQ